MDSTNQKPAYDSKAMPDAASVHVLYAGNLADDDFMWIVECTIEEFQKMLNYPVEWVRNLSLLPDWSMAGGKEPAPPALLLNHFTMRIQHRGDDSESDLITIQGISKTGIVTVRASAASAVAGVRNLSAFREAAAQASATEENSYADPSAAVFDTYWDTVAYDPNNAPSYKKVYAVNVNPSDARYYGHFEVCQPGTGSSQDRIAQTAAFILALGSDPQGFTTMLNGLDQTTFYIGSYGASAGNPIAMQYPTTLSGGPTILYTSLDAATDASCLMLDGVYVPPPSGTGGTGTVDNPVVKKYGVNEDPNPNS